MSEGCNKLEKKVILYGVHRFRAFTTTGFWWRHYSNNELFSFHVVVPRGCSRVKTCPLSSIDVRNQSTGGGGAQLRGRELYVCRGWIGGRPWGNRPQCRETGTCQG